MNTPKSSNQVRQAIMRILVISVSLSLAVYLIVDAQHNVGYVAAQDRPETKKSKTSPSKEQKLDTELFDHPHGLLDHDYAIELVPETLTDQKQVEQKSLKLKVHKPKPDMIRYLKHQVVQRLKKLNGQSDVAGLNAQELSKLKKLNTEIQGNLRALHSRFAHTSKSMAPRPMTHTQAIPVDPETLAALKKLVKLKQ